MKKRHSITLAALIIINIIAYALAGYPSLQSAMLTVFLSAMIVSGGIIVFYSVKNLIALEDADRLEVLIGIIITIALIFIWATY